MRKLFLYLLLIGFIYQSTMQLWIITSFYSQREYIASNLCVNRFETIQVCKGQCYLTKELKENEKKQEQQLPDLKQKEIQLFTMTSFHIKLEPVSMLQAEKTTTSMQNLISSGFNFSVFHPPKLA